MKITFVGTSHGVPEPNRKCSCIMVQVGERVYFVDMGTSAMDALRLRGIAPERVQAVFITHMHGDHTNGLLQFVDLVTWYFKTARPVICLPDLRAADAIGQWLACNGIQAPMNARFQAVCPDVFYEDEALRVTAIPTRHAPGSHAFLLEAEGKRVLITGDLKHPAVDFPLVEGKLDLVVAESAHFPASAYLEVLAARPPAKICITHYSPRCTASVYDTLEAFHRNGVPAALATDGLELSI